MTVRYGANGMPMKKKEKPEALQEILEVNPNVVEEEEVVEEENLSSDWITEEEEE